MAFVPGAPFYANEPQANTLRLSFVTVPAEKIEAGVQILGALLKAEIAGCSRRCCRLNPCARSLQPDDSGLAAAAERRLACSHERTRSDCLIHGASGRMGQALLRLCAEQAGCQIVAAVTRKSPAQRVVDGVPFFAAKELSGVPAFDVAIDFSLPEGFDPVLALCVARGAALVSGHHRLVRGAARRTGRGGGDASRWCGPPISAWAWRC